MCHAHAAGDQSPSPDDARHDRFAVRRLVPSEPLVSSTAVMPGHAEGFGGGNARLPRDHSSQISLVATGECSYDALGRVLTSSQVFGGVSRSKNFTYTYNHLGLLSVRYPSGTTTTYTYSSH